MLADYERVVDDVDLASISARERVLRHDVKARIEEFNALAGHEHVHKGMTSRDLTENVEQLQIRRSLEVIFAHGVAAVARLAERAVSYRDLIMAGRSHNVAAQATTLGKRFASAAQEMMIALRRLRELIDRYPLRGIKARWAPVRTCSICWAVTVRRWPISSGASPTSWALQLFSTAWGRCIRVHWTTTWFRLWCSSARGRHHWHTRFD